MKTGNNFILVGSSAEKLFSQPVSGLKDGIVVTLSPSFGFISILRSFNSQSSRTWFYSTATNFLGGSAITGEKREAVVTKYSNKWLPEWTTRFSAIGAARVVDVTTTLHLALISSTGAVPGLKVGSLQQKAP